MKTLGAILGLIAGLAVLITIVAPVATLWNVAKNQNCPGAVETGLHCGDPDLQGYGTQLGDAPRPTALCEPADAELCKPHKITPVYKTVPAQTPTTYTP